ncbi:3-oxoacyl-[acyl-carrier-protein] synthase III [Dysgonomonas hofstadii]|uniref:3-oxoacyl-[acyl-carrier-protein] synthase III n=1 Tax=Dysgonomonas hofstadii TaxID=637886 RepID=A0A840CTN8_9BACT|nr:3-oxoacyl-[acyl-carrier-protein] synthase III [Dysgonomonas hofstadii]
MLINSVGYYIPETRIPNDYFTGVNGLTSDWIAQRTGMLSRSRASERETMDYMCSRKKCPACFTLRYQGSRPDRICFLYSL